MEKTIASLIHMCLECTSFRSIFFSLSLSVPGLITAAIWIRNCRWILVNSSQTEKTFKIDLKCLFHLPRENMSRLKEKSRITQ